MRVGPIAHGALLVAALGFAYQTWTRDKSGTPKVGTVTVWDEAIGDFEAFAYDGAGKSIRVEKRGEGGDAYYWGSVTRTEKVKKQRTPSPAHSAGGLGAPPEAGGGGGPPPGAPHSPHYTGTDQPDKAAPPAGKPAAPAGKPAAPIGDKPAAPIGDKPAAPAGKPAAPTGDKPAAPAAPPDEGSPDEPDDASGGEEAPPDALQPAAPPEETKTTIKEFPIGKGGRALIENLAHLRALRDLGVLTDKQKEEYELTDSRENLTVFLKGGKQRSLIIGSRVFGGGDRYVLQAESGKGYVLSNSEIMRHIDGAESSLGLKGMHEFEDDVSSEDAVEGQPAPRNARGRYPSVVGLKIDTASGARSLVRFEEPDPTTGNTIIGWANKDKPKESDVTFGNLLTQIERLRPLDYAKDLDASTLTKVLTLQYLGAGDKQVAYLELYKKDAAVTPEVEASGEAKKTAEAEYYMKTELTRVLGKVPRTSAERIADDLPQLFGGPAPAKKERPVLKEPGVVPEEGAAPAPGQAPGKATPGKTVPAKATPGKTEPAKAAPGKTGAAKPGTDNPAKQTPDKPVPSQPGQ